METIVHPATSVGSYTIDLSPVDQLTQKLRINIVLCFPAQAQIDKYALFERLKDSLALTLAHIPILAGRVDVKDTDRSALNIVLDDDAGARFECQDYASTIPTTFAKLQYRCFSQDFLERECFWPTHYSPDDVIGARCLIAQANFICGGLLLFASFAHVITDAVAMGFVLKTWAENTREHTNLNLGQRILLPDQETYRKMLTGDQISLKNILGQQTQSSSGSYNSRFTQTEHEPFCSAMWRISSTHVEALKKDFSHSISNDGWVSTSDIVTFLLLRYTVRASGLPRPADGLIHIGILRNIRNLLDKPIPDSFIGNAIFRQIVPIPWDNLLCGDEVQAGLRTSLLIRKELTVWKDRLPLILNILASLPSFVQKETQSQFSLVTTDFSKLGVLRDDWGDGLGTASSFRLLRSHQYTPWSKVCVMPRTTEGDLDMVLETNLSTHSNMAGNTDFLKHFKLMWLTDSSKHEKMDVFANK